MKPRILFLRLMAIVLAWMAPALAYGATYYVAKTGSNSYSCTQTQSASTPRLTIAGGIACLSSGDTLIINPGVYAEAIGPSAFNGRGGTSAARTRVIGNTGAKWTLKPNAGDCSNATVIYLTDDAWIEMADMIVDANLTCDVGIRFNENSTDNYFHDFEVKNWVGTGSGSQGIGFDVGLDPHSHRNRISHAYVHATTPPPGDSLSHGMYVTGTDNIIEYSTITGPAGHGIHQHTDGVTVNHRNIYRYNFIQGTGSYGIGIYNGNDNQVYGNVLAGNGNGIRAGTAYTSAATNHTKIYNNTIYRNAGTCLVVGHAANVAVEIKNNACVDNTSNSISDAGTGTVKTNNLFSTDEMVFANVSANQFSPREGSVLIDAGTTIGLPVGLSYLGSAPDQGAVEFVSMAPTIPNAPSFLKVVP